MGRLGSFGDLIFRHRLRRPSRGTSIPGKEDLEMGSLRRRRHKMKIIVTKRHSDIHVCPEGRPDIWACGKTLDEALGNLVRSHSEHFDLEIEWNKDESWTKRYVAGDPLTRNPNK